MNVGFTGTQRGMRQTQIDSFVKTISLLEITEFRHGDCLGADHEAHGLVLLHTNIGVSIYIHPPVNGSKRAFCLASPRVRILMPKDYLARNKDIVDSTDFLIATPGEGGEVLRSGTWSTVRYARKKNKQGRIITPCGKVYDLNMVVVQ